MLRTLILALAITLVSTPALAQSTGETAQQAEYVRLSTEMKTLAAKNAWEGVEITFQKLLATGVPLKYQDYFIAAQAARAAGDVASARARLVKANKLKEEREVMDWLWEIDSSYGKVSLQCDPGTLQLTPASMPFHPDRAAAVRFAQKKIASTGDFEGYLPEGDYTFGKIKITVAPRVQTVRVDARGLAEAKRGRKAKEPKTVGEAVAEQKAKEKEKAEKEKSKETPQPKEQTEVAQEPMPQPESVATTQPAPAPETTTTEPAPSGEAVAEAEPQPAPKKVEPEKTPKVKQPKPAREGGKSPYTLGGTLGVGNSYGGIAGGGLQLVFRTAGGIFGVSGGVGYDFQYHHVGLSAAVRVYPQKNIYLGAGVAPLIWYAGDVAGVGVAHGPEVQAGADFKFGPVLIDASIGAGMARAPKGASGKFRPAISGGAGVGTKFF